MFVRFKHLLRCHANKQAHSKRASGTAEDFQEIDKFLRDINERVDNADAKRLELKKKRDERAEVVASTGERLCEDAVLRVRERERVSAAGASASF